MSAPATKPEARINPRAGLGPVAEMLAAEPISIAYFGASVTAQREGYRPRLHEGLRERFAQDHESIFAAVGGIDIAPAVFLADDLVIRHRPDLCLIEFTSAEPAAGRHLARAEAAMDGAVRKLRDVGSRPCLLHLPSREWREANADLLAAFERVADIHGIPSIDLTHLAGGDAIFRDTVHTTVSGSKLVAKLIDEAIGSIVAEYLAADLADLPDPTGDDYRGAHVLPVGADDAEGPAELRLFRLQRPFLELPGGTAIRRRFADRLAGLVMLVGPESGELEIADRSGRQRLMAWDQHCHYERFSASVFDRPCDAGGEVSIELTVTAPDYASCRRPVEPPERRTAKVMGYMVLPA